MNARRMDRAAWTIAIAAALVVAVPSRAQDAKDAVGRVAPDPFVNLVGDDAVKVEINIGPAMLRMLAAGLAESDPELRETVQGLQGIKALVLDLSRVAQADRVDTVVDDVVRKLERAGWERTARIRDESSNLNVLIRGDGEDRARGLLILVLDRDEGELAFVNLYGLVDLARLQELSTQIEVPGLDLVPPPDRRKGD